MVDARWGLGPCPKLGLVGALDRYDEWDVSAGELLATLDAGVPDVVPSLEDLYDEETVRAIDARHEPPADPNRTWRSGLASGALVVSLVNGVRDAVDPDDEVVELEQEQVDARLAPVSVYLAWGEPAASIAIVRPWLFPA